MTKKRFWKKFDKLDAGLSLETMEGVVQEARAKVDSGEWFDVSFSPEDYDENEDLDGVCHECNRSSKDYIYLYGNVVETDAAYAERLKKEAADKARQEKVAQIKSKRDAENKKKSDLKLYLKLKKEFGE